MTGNGVHAAHLGNLSAAKHVRYKRYQTPLETLLALDQPAQYLRPGLSLNVLQRIADALSDTDAARRMQQSKNKLFEQLRLSA